MKHILLKLLACSAALLPIAQAQTTAVPAKTYGGFAPGAKFTLKVNKVTSTRLKNFVSAKCPFPSGIPKFKKGAKVVFTVGRNGEWTCAGMNLRFVKDEGPSNSYVKRNSKNFNDDEANVFKDTANKAVAADIFLYKEIHGSLGTIPVVYTVKYVFGK